MTALNVVFPEEIGFFIQSLKKFQLSEIGTKSWLEHHEVLLKLNQQTIIEASQYREETVKELLLEYDKLGLLVHEVYTVLLWKTKILPKLIEINPNPQASFLLYTILFHEAVAVSLLEIVLYHENGVEALGDSSLDLIDFCAQAITKLIGLVSCRHHEEGDLLQDDFERQKRDLDYKIGMKCLSILNFIVDHIEKAPMAAINRIIKVHDVPCLLSEILHLKPWLRRKKEFEKFIDDKWQVVRNDNLLKVTKTEAHTWFAFRQVLLNQKICRLYEITEFRQRELAKCQVLLSEHLLDQLPPLIELKQVLCSLSISSQKPKDNLMLEELPEIKDKIINKAKEYGWKRLIEEHKNRFLNLEQSEILEIAKHLNIAYNLDLLEQMEPEASTAPNDSEMRCMNCKKECTKKCSSCEAAYYCSRECQIQNWKTHKPLCEMKKL